MNAETGGYHKEVTIVQAADGEACGGTRVSPFDRPEWFALLAESRPGAFTASAPQDDATVSMPLNRTDGRIEALRNWYSFTWRPLVPHGATGETALQRL
ncbi:MAG: GNAT family N-acetyltransferase, partial [Alteriqipengyuania sp.]